MIDLNAYSFCLAPPPSNSTLRRWKVDRCLKACQVLLSHIFPRPNGISYEALRLSRRLRGSLVLETQIVGAPMPREITKSDSWISENRAFASARAETSGVFSRVPSLETCWFQIFFNWGNSAQRQSNDNWNWEVDIPLGCQGISCTDYCKCRACLSLGERPTFPTLVLCHRIL